MEKAFNIFDYRIKINIVAETLIVPKGNRETIYKALIPQIESITSGEKNITANLANIAAILKEAFGFFWVGFYTVDTDGTLVLAPFQGPLACTRIRKGKGVCGTVYAEAKSLVVEDVELFPGHIACSSLSRSEVVVPIMKNEDVWGVIDIDSSEVNDFSDIDRIYLEQVAQIITKFLK